MLLCFVFVATMLAVANATCMGHLHHRAFDNNTVEVSKFGYTGGIGPLLWQTLATANALCEKGESQSPINIGKQQLNLYVGFSASVCVNLKQTDYIRTNIIDTDSSIKRAVTRPKVNFAKIKTANFENLGTTVEVIANGTTQFGNKTFNLKQFHFHSPSEHRIDEEYFPLEMHMVHQAAGKTSIKTSRVINSEN